MMKEYIGYKVGDRVTIEFEGLRISGVLKKIKKGKRGVLAVVDAMDFLTVPFCCIYKEV